MFKIVDWFKISKGISYTLEFYALNKGLTFDEAVEKCNARNQSLVTIKSQKRQDFIFGTILTSLPSTNHSKSVWLGADNAVATRQFKWLNDGNNLTYSNWASDEPCNNSTQRSAIVMDRNTGKWFAFDVSHKTRVICEKPGLSSDVLDLSASTLREFEAKIALYDFLLIQFYAPWCRHSKRLAPEFEKAATLLVQRKPPVTLAKVDCDSTLSGEILCNAYDIPSYPTVNLFSHGQFDQAYTGNRSAEAIVTFMVSVLN